MTGKYTSLTDIILIYSLFNSDLKQHYNRLQCSANMTMTFPRVHCGLSFLLFCVAALMTGISLYIKIDFSADFENVYNVMESFNSGGLGPISPDGVKEGLELDNSARKIDTIFWFFTVGAIIMLSRAAIFALCASKSKSQCLQGMRMEVIESLTETEDVELSQTTGLEK